LQEKYESAEQNNIELTLEIQDLQFFRNCIFVILGVLILTFAILIKSLFNKLKQISNSNINTKLTPNMTPPEDCLDEVETETSKKKSKGKKN